MLTAKLSSQIGMNLRHVAVVPDEHDVIGEHVRELSRKYDHVFTSGGIGPTHDDITYEAIGKAFNQPLAFHQSTLERMEEYFSEQRKLLNPSRKRMALFPQSATVYYTASAPTAYLAVKELLDKSIVRYEQPSAANHIPSPRASVWVPIVSVENVHILPGIPTLFTHLATHYFLNYLQPAIRKEDGKAPLFRKIYGTKLTEGDFAEHLASIQLKFEGEVTIGSYPKWKFPDSTATNKDDVRVVISFEGDSESDVMDCIHQTNAGMKIFELPEVN
eukprot:Partr_v1_DN25504_c1_g1_i1_m20504 putative FAD1 flavin adenine dinucleotide synthetase homolog (S. cerevisiae)